MMDDGDFIVVHDYESWFKAGRDMGWIGDVFCYVHGVPDLTPKEVQLIESADGDPDVICVFAARVGD